MHPDMHAYIHSPPPGPAPGRSPACEPLRKPDHGLAFLTEPLTRKFEQNWGNAFASRAGHPISDDMITRRTTLLGLLAALTFTPPSLVAQEAGPDIITRWTEDRSQIFDGAEIVLDDLLWQARAVVVFANSADDPLFIRQIELLQARPDDLAERDVILIADTDPANPSALRLQLRPRGFMLVLMEKDGVIELRKPSPWDVRELSRSIDKMPLRQQEIRDRRGG